MPKLIPRELVAERAAASFVGLAPHIMGVCHALARGLSLSPGWSLGDPPGPPAPLDAPAVQQLVARVVEEQSHGFPATCWLTAAGEPPPTAVFTVDPTGTPGVAHARCALPDPPLPSAAMASLVRDVAEAFGAYQAYIEDDALLLRYFSRRATERARAATPPELRHLVPDPPELDDVDLNLLVVHDYDRLRVPAGVFWVNYWSAALVATLGQSRILAAGWAKVLPASHGALVLVATDEPLDPDDRAHLDHLRSLIRKLGLREAQERMRR